jgi:thiamine kinase-like enzyme
MTIRIDEVIERIVEWQGKELSVTPLHGGLTNSNYRVDVHGKSFVVRIPGASTELLAIDRENELFNTQAAAEAGIAPKVIFCLPEENIMVIEFIHGITMSNESFQKPGMPRRIAASLKCLHNGPRFLTDFNMFRLTEYYLKTVEDLKIPIPPGYDKRMATIQAIEQACLVYPLPAAPCNNDMLAENYIDDGEKLWLIDYEYSGNNDPCFELGNTSQELGFNDEQMSELCEAYFGKPSEAMMARMKLNMIMSDTGWGLWAAIQANISTIEYNFWGWAVERWERAEEKMDSDQFSRWLKDVQRAY